MNETPIVTKSQLVTEFRRLGVSSGQTIMLHASVKSIGWIVGGPDIILEALLEVLGADGTLMMYVSWDQSPYHFQEWSPEKQKAVRDELPAFQPLKSRAHREWSILTEYIRTWPKAFQSNHPEASIVAVGKQAAWITKDHPTNYGYGVGSPLEKLCQLQGKVLMLGAPLNTMTVLHYAEHIADVPNKRVVRYQSPVLENGVKVWRDFEEFDTSQGIVDWPGDDYFEIIGKEFLAAGNGGNNAVGASTSYLFDAATLVAFGKQWMEEKFRRVE